MQHLLILIINLHEFLFSMYLLKLLYRILDNYAYVTNVDIVSCNITFELLNERLEITLK